MKKICVLSVLGCLYLCADDVITITTTPQVKNEPLHIYAGILAPAQSFVHSLLPHVKNDIEQSKQFVFQCAPCVMPRHRQDILDLFGQGYPLSK